MSPDFTALEGAVLQALVDRNWNELADLLSDDFVITTAGWLPEPASRQRWLEEVEQHHLNAFEIDTVDVRNLGDVAVVFGAVDPVGSLDRRNISLPVPIHRRLAPTRR
ncbi:MAG: nuclear transport factor 2 family protein [Nocardioidaceae bacterium]|nr:nuclear transport factor 2 family protein [Nocardioidaceae bacterium]